MTSSSAASSVALAGRTEGPPYSRGLSATEKESRHVPVRKPESAYMLKGAGASAVGRSLATALMQMPGLARAQDIQPQAQATRMATFNATEQVSLEPVDAADVTILVDNAIDILAADTDVAKRQPLAYEWSRTAAPAAFRARLLACPDRTAQWPQRYDPV
jgi:hypothetical protein